MKRSLEFWYHEYTGSFGIACGVHITFEFDGRIEESYWPLLRDTGQWIYIGEV